MAEDIADTVWYVANTPAHVCINDLVITCTAQANSMYLQKQNDFELNDYYPKSISVLSPIFSVRLMPLMAEDIADTVWYVANTPAHVCINDLVITCTAQANSMYLQK